MGDFEFAHFLADAKLAGTCDSCEGTGTWTHIGERDIFMQPCGICGGSGWYVPPLEAMTTRLANAVLKEYTEWLAQKLNELQQENQRLKGALDWRDNP